MPTVIDSLIVEIGLDPLKFTSGQKATIKSFNDTKEGAQKTGTEIERIGIRSSEFLSLLQNRLLRVGELLVTTFGAYGIGKLVTEMTKQDAATGRLAYTLETSVGALDRWRNAAYLVGGSAEGITGFIQGLTSEFHKFAITGESNLIPYFRGLGVQIADTNGKMRPFADIMRDVSNAVQKLGPAQGSEWLRSIGADQGSINLLIKGGDELERLLRLGGQFGTLTAQQTENATKLAVAMAQLNLAATEWSRTLLNAVTPALIKVGETSSKILNDRGNIDKRSIFGRALEYLGLGKPEGSSAPKPAGPFSSAAEKEAFIRSEAVKRGISPDVAVAVAKSEGFNSYVGDQGTSFGAFQLHYKNNIPGLSLSGLGDTFTKQTGLDARDPSTERQQIQFALDQAAKGGWAPWHGWKGAPFAGIEKSNSSSSTTTIGTIVVNTQATDAAGIASSIGPAIQRSSETYHSQSGPQ